MSVDMKEFNARMDLQNAEFEAVHNLSEAYKSLSYTPIVDDDYPDVRSRYEGCMYRLVQALKANGRL